MPLKILKLKFKEIEKEEKVLLNQLHFKDLFLHCYKKLLSQNLFKIPGHDCDIVCMKIDYSFDNVNSHHTKLIKQTTQTKNKTCLFFNNFRLTSVTKTWDNMISSFLYQYKRKT